MKNGGDIAEKSYLSIGEVAKKFGISVETLRKWERDFSGFLKPKRTSNDTRLYDKKQQERVEVILRLLRDDGLSIEGAKKKLKTKQNDEEVRQEVIGRLKGIRERLMAVVEEIETLERKTNPQLREGVVWINK